MGNNQELPSVVKLVVTRRLSSCVEEANLSKGATHCLSFGTTALLHAEDGDGFMSTVGDNDKAT